MRQHDIHRFRGRTELEALRRARAELGSECEVVSTRVVYDGVWNRLCGWKQFEVQAVEREPELAANISVEAESEPAWSSAVDWDATPMPLLDGHETRESLRQNLPGWDLEPQHAVWPGHESSGPAGHYEQAAVCEVFRQMVSAGVPEALGRQLVQQIYDLDEPQELEDVASVRAAVAAQILDHIRYGVPNDDADTLPAVTAVVGPSGAGKTSVCVKLAADLRLRLKQRIAFVSVDTYRVAAAEQLRALGELLDAPVDIVATPRELRRAVTTRLNDQFLVIIDTAGRNPRDESAMQELRLLLNQARPDRVHLVLNATDSASHLTSCAGAFVAAGANSLVLTKLDEASVLGNLLPLLLANLLPLGFVSHGQNLRLDFRAVQVEELLPRMLGGYVPRETPWETPAKLAPLSSWTGRRSDR